MNTHTIFVGSHNPVKLNAVKSAAETLGDVKVEGFDVASGVSSQPMTDEETRQGAENRARAALAEGYKVLGAGYKEEDIHLGVGMEGGVFQNEKGELWSTVWAVVIDGQTQETYQANGGRVQVPPLIAQRMLAGEEMGPLMQSLTGISDVRTKQGMFGVLTNNMVQRTEEYATIVKLALGIWYGREWAAGLVQTSQTQA